MKEKIFISTIKSILNSEYIGDDCAYLKDLNIVVTQDSLVEDIHFKREFITPFQLGYKSIMVNLSDIASSGADAAYLTISLSLPKETTQNFVKDFYEGAKSACPENVKIVGGDITGADKIFISVCAIGKTAERNISSRKNARPGYKIIVSGNHGSSAAGLISLSKNKDNIFVKSHLMPQAQSEFGKRIAQTVKTPYAMMDTSDGLMDTLLTIAKESNVCLEVDFERIPHHPELENFNNWQDLVLFGGEDYQLIACVPQDYDGGFSIGHVKNGTGVNLKKNNQIIHYTYQDLEDKIFNHFN